MDAAVEAKLLVNGKPLASMSISTKVRRISQIVRLAAVFEYVDPILATGHAEVGRYALGGSEIVENRDNVAMTIDLSTITVPDGCCFETVTVDAGRIVRARLRFIGAEQTLSCRIPMSVRYEFLQTIRVNAAMAARTAWLTCWAAKVRITEMGRRVLKSVLLSSETRCKSRRGGAVAFTPRSDIHSVLVSPISPN